MKYGFAIDRGGTFTDVFVYRSDGTSRVLKLLSEDPANYVDAPTEGIRRVLQEELNQVHPRGEPIDGSHISWIRMGTTVATNALLERKGEPIALLITKGFRDLLRIGNQSRVKLFDLRLVDVDMLYDRVVEIDERIIVRIEDELQTGEEQLIKGTNDIDYSIAKPIDVTAVGNSLTDILNSGIKSLAVAFMHSYVVPNHEIEVKQLAISMGFENVSISSNIMPMVKIVPRGFTATADAYLTPVITRYIDGFLSGFKNKLKNTPVLFMQSNGGLCPVHAFTGSRAILSGPAGGVIGIAGTSYDQTLKQPVIGFDMGGTSTDVSRFAGEFEQVFESTTAGVTIQAPQLDINTVAAGGGSRLFYRSGMFVVGPESAGANPGPVCYKKGGYLAVTDANVVLGRVMPDYFPKIFGPSEDEPLDRQAALDSMNEIGREIPKIDDSTASMTAEEIALGFVRVANESMCRPIRAITQAKGYDPSVHVLSCFGGAGGQHACAVAKSLGVKRVFVHRHSGILSAYGLALADVVTEAQEPCSKFYEKENFEYINDRFDSLISKCVHELSEEGFARDDIVVESFLHMRYDRTDCALMCSPRGQHSTGTDDYLGCFLANYKREFGFTIPDRPVVVDDIRVRGVGKSAINTEKQIQKSTSIVATPEKVTQSYFEEGYLETKVFLLEKLLSGHEIIGPAIIIDQNFTILVEPCCVAHITDCGNVEIAIKDSKRNKQIDSETIDLIQLSIFSNRFMSIAEQMGRILQRTSISTNIKERLDFSCAMFGPDGGLIANAPHIPVHLGAMQETVRFQMGYLGEELYDGDVILCNHPCAGGSHLPDLTVITPVFYRQSKSPVFFVASRGHHADIGGLTPGSMPPSSTLLEQEGAAFLSFKLVENGKFREEKLTEALMAPEKVKDCSGTRNLTDNLSDLKAQIAANQKGIGLICQLIDEYGLEVVQAYMKYIQDNAELCVRHLLKDVGKERLKNGSSHLHAVDFMDDGTPLELTIKIDCQMGEAVFDFTGTGFEVFGNCNAPKAVTYSAIIYCLRCLVGHDIPLNQGCLNPISVILPENSILNPSSISAVVGGNVLTSQRIVDVILKTFEAVSASQGCMNNITFGNDQFGYYETVCGGSGAGPGWDGRSGVHSHMTNTRITDPEILENRYPVILNQFCLIPNSGGDGKYKGGDGVVREYLFRKPLTLSILTERRSFAPYGLKGGSNGKRGLNLIKFSSGRTVNIGAKALLQANAGDIFVLNTPGGGGWGVKSGDIDNDEQSGEDSVIAKRLNNQLEIISDVKPIHKTGGSLHLFESTQNTS